MHMNTVPTVLSPALTMPLEDRCHSKQMQLATRKEAERGKLMAER